MWLREEGRGGSNSNNVNTWCVLDAPNASCFLAPRVDHHARRRMPIERYKHH